MRHPPAWAHFGSEVRRLRFRAGLSQSQLAKAVPLSQSMLSGIELGRKGAKRDHAEAFDRTFNTNGKLVRLWDALNSAPAHPDWFQEVLALERKAVEIRQYQPIVIPGLLQTDDYARSLFRATQTWASEAEIEELVHARMSRCEILDEPNRPITWFVVEQVVIDRVIGSPAVMKEQLAYLLHLIERYVIRLQIVSQKTPVHPGSSGALRVLAFDDRPSVVHADHVFGGHISARPDEVRKCSAIFSALQSEAMSPDASADLIRSRKGQL